MLFTRGLVPAMLRSSCIVFMAVSKQDGRMRGVSAGVTPGAVPQGACICFISSYTAYHAEAPIAMYAVSKTALVALSKALAEELGPDGIRVNCVAPGDGAPAVTPALFSLCKCTVQLSMWQHDMVGVTHYIMAVLMSLVPCLMLMMVHQPHIHDSWAAG